MPIGHLRDHPFPFLCKQVEASVVGCYIFIFPMWTVILSGESRHGWKGDIVASFCAPKSLHAQAPLNKRRTPDWFSHLLFTIYPKTAMPKWKKKPQKIWDRYLASSMFGSRPSPPCIHLPVGNLRPSSGLGIISFSTRRRNWSQILHHNSPADDFPFMRPESSNHWFTQSAFTVNQPQFDSAAKAVICRQLQTTPRKHSVKVSPFKYSVSRHSDVTKVISDVTFYSTIFPKQALISFNKYIASW